MYRRLRFVIPIAQAVAAVVVFIAAKLYGGSRFYLYYLADAKDVIMHINLPLVVFWILIFSPITLLSPYLPFLSRPLPLVGTVVVAVLLASTVVLFWYFVVVEVEMRSQGRSLLRPSRRSMALAAATTLLFFGVAAGLYCYTVSRPLWYARRADAIVEAVFPAIWGIVLAGTAIQDFIISFRNNKHRSAGSSA